MLLIVRSLPAAAAGLVLAQPVLAYVGPGAGLSLITAFGVLAAAIFSSIAFLILWPLRRARRRRRLERQQEAVAPVGEVPDEAEAVEGGLLHRR